jgi:hypothetical protein
MGAEGFTHAEGFTAGSATAPALRPALRFGMVRAALPAADSLMVRWGAAAPDSDPGHFVGRAALQVHTAPTETQPQVAGGVK